MHSVPSVSLSDTSFARQCLTALLFAGGLAAGVAGCAGPAPIAPQPSGQPPVAAISSSGPVVPRAEAATDAVDAAHQAALETWLASLRTDARASGISEATLSAALGDVRFLPRVVELDKVQPEFTRTPWDYLDRTVTAQRIQLGQEKLRQVQAEAGQVLQRHDVPAEVVVAIWGMESNYGSNYGDTPTIDALATLGFEGRRANWARRELLAALRILDLGDIPRAQMIGSWAGAMGQTQFLPSSFLTYAVDGDGDGRRDIWGSLPDVVASTANYLARAGWQAQQPWGVEVRLPVAWDYARADPSVTLPAAQWAAEGITTLNGAPLPSLTDTSILLPAGARGPAFLVGANFRAILRYNNSTNYALAVGLLAQQLAGGPGVQASWPRELAALSRNDMAELQRALGERGFESGAADGVFGPATRGAVRAYQRSEGLVPDGFPDLELLRRLRPSGGSPQ
ncbi:MAG: lytic murein transglycosylase [Variovorax sp.]|nr:MAG: lytic murein transglycosylase [Variovorax sp.]